MGFIPERLLIMMMMMTYIKLFIYIHVIIIGIHLGIDTWIKLIATKWKSESS